MLNSVFSHHHYYCHQYRLDVVFDLQPDDEGSLEVSVRMVGMIEPVEHMGSRSYIHVAPELRLILVRTMSRLWLEPSSVLYLFDRLFHFKTMIYTELSHFEMLQNSQILLLTEAIQKGIHCSVLWHFLVFVFLSSCLCLIGIPHWVFCFVFFCLSAPVQFIAWKDSSPKWPIK